MTFSLGGHSDFLLIIGQVVDTNFPTSNAFYDFLFNLIYIGFFTPFDLYLMRCDNFHLILIPFAFLFLGGIIMTTILIIFTSIMTHIIWIALSTDC